MATAVNRLSLTIVMAAVSTVTLAADDANERKRIDAIKADDRLLPPADEPSPRVRIGGQREATKPAVPVPWRLVTRWKAREESGASFKVHGPDDLVGVALEFGDGVPEPEKDRFLADASGQHEPDGLRIRIDTRLDAAQLPGGTNLARQSLGFFWQPGVKSRPRFSLVLDSVEAVDPKATPDAKKGAGTYAVISHSQPVPVDQLNAPGMTAFTGLLTEIGREKRGRVFWLVEPNDPNPAHVVVGWQPHGVAWVGAKLASPMWPEVFEVAAFEPPSEWVSAVAAGRALGTSGPARTGLVKVPEGTWNILKQCEAGAKLISLGHEGVVLETADGYEVHVLRNSHYDREPIRTRGLAVDPPPGWAASFGLRAKWDADQARHLVALAVCSQAVWKRHRGPGSPPRDEHLRSLFMDPELWACPQR